MNYYSAYINGPWGYIETKKNTFQKIYFSFLRVLKGIKKLRQNSRGTGFLTYCVCSLTVTIMCDRSLSD